jgi:hypothetical protein
MIDAILSMLIKHKKSNPTNLRDPYLIAKKTDQPSIKPTNCQ